MKQILPVFLISLFLTGCATTPELHRLNQDYVLKSDGSSVVFGKVNPRGLFLKAPYLQLSIENKSNVTEKCSFCIGDKMGQFKLPWDMKPVGSEYFFIELKDGEYKISSITMPMGQMEAIEDADISFSVEPHSVVYIGTLEVTGTKEKMKTGDFPLMSPGFGYTAKILEEQEEAIKEFRARYPLVKEDIKINLMKLNKSTNE